MFMELPVIVIIRQALGMMIPTASLSTMAKVLFAISPPSFPVPTTSTPRVIRVQFAITIADPPGISIDRLVELGVPAAVPPKSHPRIRMLNAVESIP